MARRGTIFLLVMILGACGASSPAPAHDGGSGPSDAPPTDRWAPPPPPCGEPDRSCPAELPFTSGPCEGALVCPYPSYEVRCVDGRWNVSPLCDGVPPGGACLPPLVESCDAPFEGTLSGASVTIGPFGQDRAFEPDELVPIVWGSQGGAMIQWALHIDGVATPPDCVQAEVITSVDTGEPYRVEQPMRLHCGDSLATLLVLAAHPCEMREYVVRLTVRVVGIGEASATLRVAGGRCPRGGEL